MGRVAILGVVTSFVLATSTAYARDMDGAAPVDLLPDGPAPPSTETAAIAPRPSPSACTGVSGFVISSCPLAWRGVTLYGAIDVGADWQSHGVRFNGSSLSGLEYLLQKNSNGAGFHFAPNQLSQSTIGLRGEEAVLPDWHLVFDVEAGFDPYSMRFADGPGSVRENAGVPLNAQSTAADSSRAGQFFNSAGFIGVTSATFGALTLFRQSALTLDGVLAYDPLSGSYAFSPIGYQGFAVGGGDSEDGRFSTAVKYRLGHGPVRAAALYQFGGYRLDNAADTAVQLQLGGDIDHVAGGTVSLDGIYSRLTDAVALSLGGRTGPPAPFQTVTATISDNTSWMGLLRYVKGPVKLYGGYEWISYGDPSDAKQSFYDISGEFICLGCATLNNTTISNNTFASHHKILEIIWGGVRFAISRKLTLLAGYYEYLQNSYGSGAACGNSSKATCSGLYTAVSVALVYELAEKFDAYAGFMSQTESGGLDSGFLHHDTIDPGVGVRFHF